MRSTSESMPHTCCRAAEWGPIHGKNLGIALRASSSYRCIWYVAAYHHQLLQKSAHKWNSRMICEALRMSAGKIFVLQQLGCHLIETSFRDSVGFPSLPCY